MYPVSKRISPESHILKSDRYWGYHPWYFSQRSFPTERKERRKEGGRRMEGKKKKEKPTSSKKKQNIWDLKTLQSISKVGKISQSWWIKFPWLPALRASLQGEEPSAIPHSPPLHPPPPPRQHTHTLTLDSWINTNTSYTKGLQAKPSYSLNWLTLGSTKVTKYLNFW